MNFVVIAILIELIPSDFFLAAWGLKRVDGVGE